MSHLTGLYVITCLLVLDVAEVGDLLDSLPGDDYTSERDAALDNLVSKWLGESNNHHSNVLDDVNDIPLHSVPRLNSLVSKRGNLLSQCCQKGCRVADLIDMVSC